MKLFRRKKRNQCMLIPVQVDDVQEWSDGDRAAFNQFLSTPVGEKLRHHLYHAMYSSALSVNPSANADFERGQVKGLSSMLGFLLSLAFVAEQTAEE